MPPSTVLPSDNDNTDTIGSSPSESSIRSFKEELQKVGLPPETDPLDFRSVFLLEPLLQIYICLAPCCNADLLNSLLVQVVASLLESKVTQLPMFIPLNPTIDKYWDDALLELFQLPPDVRQKGSVALTILYHFARKFCHPRTDNLGLMERTLYRLSGLSEQDPVNEIIPTEYRFPLLQPRFTYAPTPPGFPLLVPKNPPPKNDSRRLLRHALTNNLGSQVV